MHRMSTTKAFKECAGVEGMADISTPGLVEELEELIGLVAMDGCVVLCVV